jgi:F0F1-type ATP synthase membrane subunit a
MKEIAGTLKSNLIHWFWIVLPLFIVFIVIGLEITIAFLQAYVFVVLLSIYWNDGRRIKLRIYFSVIFSLDKLNK